MLGQSSALDRLFAAAEVRGLCGELVTNGKKTIESDTKPQQIVHLQVTRKDRPRIPVVRVSTTLHTLDTDADDLRGRL